MSIYSSLIGKITFLTQIGLLSTVLLSLGMGSAGCGKDIELGTDFAWPIASSDRPATLSSTFGPRIQGSNDDYDFHRGIDIPVPIGTRVDAAAPGQVVVAGNDRHYPDDSIQIAHCADAIEPASIDSCETPFFTLYSHMSKIDVQVGDWLDSGEYIGLSGASRSGFEHLHFEIREGGSWQRDSVHPLAFLPHDDTSPAEVDIDAVLFDDPVAPLIVHAVVTRPATELDFQRIEVELYSANDDRLMSSHSYDVNEWNREYTPEEDPEEKLDNPFFNGITVRPEPFGMDSDTYSVLFRFRTLEADVPEDESSRRRPHRGCQWSGRYGRVPSVLVTSVLRSGCTRASAS